MSRGLFELTPYHWGLVAVLMAVWLLNSTFQMLHSILMPSIMEEWLLDYSRVGYILIASQLSASIGSFLFGSLADYIGRKRTLLLLLPLSSASIFLVGLSSSLFHFTVALAAFSFASSGVFPVIFTFASEELPASRRGFGISVIASGYALGGGGSASLIASSLGLGSWRTPFLVGVIPTIIIVIGVTRLAESRIWVNGGWRNRKEDRAVMRSLKSLLDLWRGEHRRSVLSATAVRCLASVLWVGVARWVTVFLVVERKMPLEVGTIWFTFFGLAGFLGNWFNGWCADRYGRRKTISLFFVMVGVFITVFTVFTNGKLEALLLTAPLGFLLLGLYPTTFTFTTEVLPDEARGLGMSAVNAFTIPFSIALPGVIGTVSDLYSLSLCFYAIALTTLIGGVVLFFVMPEITTNPSKI